MTPQRQNLIASFAGAAIGLLVEHSNPIAVLYGIGGFTAGPWVLGRVKQLVNKTRQSAAPANTSVGTPDYRL